MAGTQDAPPPPSPSPTHAAGADAPPDDAGEAGDGCTDGGLREEKKRRRRAALHEAALRLSAAHGPDVTVEEICADVGVSRRTFFNYFASKDDAVFGDPPHPPTDADLAAFEAGGPTGELWADLADVAARHLTRAMPSIGEMVQRRALVDAHPEFRLRLIGGFAAVERRMALAIARRTGGAVDELEPQLTAAVSGAAMRISVQRWVRQGGEQPLAGHVRAVFAALPRR